MNSITWIRPFVLVDLNDVYTDNVKQKTIRLMCISDITFNTLPTIAFVSQPQYKAFHKTTTISQNTYFCMKK